MSEVCARSDNGNFHGLSRNGVHYFHSIAYSHIPGPFERAEKVGYQGEVDATVPRPEEIALTITAPAQAPAAGAPVIVYIHGGRYETGTHEDPRTDGTHNAQSGVVQVQLGYRVGLPGFAKFETDEYFFYRGIDDCQLGLEWIQNNIDAFGGDPTNVTIVAQSAGATTALWLTRRDHYKGAFRRVVALSPCFPREGFEHRKATLRQALGKPLTKDSLASLSQSQLNRAYAKFRKKFGFDMALGPYPLDPRELADVPIILGSTREEFYNLGEKYKSKAIAWWLAPKFGMRREKFGTWADLSGAAPHYTGRLIGDGNIRRWVQLVAAQATGQTWMVEFVRDEPALHCQELRPLFGDTPLNEWLRNLVRTGEPGFGEYRPEHAVWVYNLDSHAHRVAHGTLDYVAQAFSED